MCSISFGCPAISKAKPAANSGLIRCMRINSAIAFAGFCLALSAAPLLAHHSTAGMYDISKTITIEGTVTGLEWLNPHARFGLDATNSDATVSKWELEMAAPHALVKSRRTEGFHQAGRSRKRYFLACKGWFPVGLSAYDYVPRRPRDQPSTCLDGFTKDNSINRFHRGSETMYCSGTLSAAGDLRN